MDSKVTREQVEQVLKVCQWNKKRAAEKLRMHRKQLY
ncbi:MAG: hypothetical protein IBX60_01270 [Candidatus Aminicenantes bacterium]|nr:hypothetical protein [Candidatus Aminicenantes bacterium]